MSDEQEPRPPSEGRPGAGSSPAGDGSSPAGDGTSPCEPASRRSGPPEPTPAPEAGRGNPGLGLHPDGLTPSRRSRDRARTRSRHGRRRRRYTKILGVTAAGTVAIALALTTTSAYVVHHLLGKVATVNLNSLTHRPPAASPDAEGRTPLNVLVLGSQTRDGQNLATHVGNSSKDGTDLSDTAMLVHVSADRKWAEVASIPRDLFVSIPACTDRINPSISHPAQAEAEFYNAMGEGGPVCAVATVEQMTNIRIDHVVELTFNAFIELTDAVGGVQVCVPQPGIDDPDYSGLVLSAGLHTVTGNQALAFVRDRHGLAGGMDTERIRMQQEFMSSLFGKVTSDGTLENPVTLFRVANAVAGNITVDTGLDSLSAMTSTVQSIGTVDRKYMQYVTAPYAFDQPGEYAYDPDGDHSSPGAGFNALWDLLREDRPLPGSPAAASAAGAGTRAGTGTGTGTGTHAGTNAAPAAAGAGVPPLAPLPDMHDFPGSAAPSPGDSTDTDSRNGDAGLCSNLPGSATEGDGSGPGPGLGSGSSSGG